MEGTDMEKNTISDSMNTVNINDNQTEEFTIEKENKCGTVRIKENDKLEFMKTYATAVKAYELKFDTSLLFKQAKISNDGKEIVIVDDELVAKAGLAVLIGLVGETNMQVSLLTHTLCKTEYVYVRAMGSAQLALEVCRTTQQSSFVNTDSHGHVIKHVSKVTVRQPSYQNSMGHMDLCVQQSISGLSERGTTSARISDKYIGLDPREKATKFKRVALYSIGLLAKSLRNGFEYRLCLQPSTCTLFMQVIPFLSSEFHDLLLKGAR
ncbi:hypothetical protein Tco_0087870 [Tanacetum coccineum]